MGRKNVEPTIGITRHHKGIYAYIEKNEQVLLVLKNRGPYTGLYDLPGGSPKENEIDIETLDRELREETGCLLKDCCFREDRTVIFDGFIDDNGQPGCLSHRGIIFNCEVEGTPDNALVSSDTDGALWVKKADINESNATPFVLWCVKN